MVCALEGATIPCFYLCTVPARMCILIPCWGWSSGARVLGKHFHCQGVLLIWIKVGKGPSGPVVGGGCLDIFSLVYHFSSFSLSLGDGQI